MQAQMTQLTPAAQMTQMLFSIWTPAIMGTISRLGIPDLVAGEPKTIEQLAKVTNTHAPSLYRLLRGSASLGVLVEDNQGRFGNTPLSETLRSDVVPSLRGVAIFLTDEWSLRSIEKLLYSVQSGKPALNHVYGKSAWEYFGEHTEESAIFQVGMTNLSMSQAPAVAAAYDFSSIETLADIGGGHGLLLTTILKKYPAMRGFLFDLPQVIEGARNGPYLAEMNERIEVRAGDMFKEVPTGVDAYMMKYIIHDWNDSESQKILRNCRNGVNSGGRLLVIDQVVPPGNDPVPSKLMDLAMLVYITGKERTEKEWRDLFAASGWRLTRIVPTATEMCVIEGEPA